MSLVRSELQKIRTTRLWWGLLLGALLYTVIQAGANAALAGQSPGAGQPASPSLDTARAIRQIYATAAFQGAYIFAMILGITGMTGEYRYQTITPTFLATPRRAKVVIAKMLAHFGAGLVYGVACVIGALVVGGAVISIRGYSLGFGAHRLWPSIGLGIVAVALWTLLGIGIGTMIRNQIAAILVAVFVTFLVEPLATFILAANHHGDIVKWLPTNASTALTSPATTQLHYLSWWAGGLVLLAYAAVFAGVGMALTAKRDIT
jgi:ABC-2 type transport system permease protein